jgi:hypothetical protein
MDCQALKGSDAAPMGETRDERAGAAFFNTQEAGPSPAMAWYPGARGVP